MIFGSRSEKCAQKTGWGTIHDNIPESMMAIFLVYGSCGASIGEGDKLENSFPVCGPYVCTPHINK